MKSRIIIIVLLLALLIAGGQLYIKASGQQSAATTADNDTVLNAIKNRTSVRAYKNQPVEKEKVEKLLRAGMAAPSAMSLAFRRGHRQATARRDWSSHAQCILCRKGATGHRGMRRYEQSHRRQRKGFLGAGLLCRHGEHSLGRSSPWTRCGMDGCLSRRGPLRYINQTAQPSGESHSAEHDCHRLSCRSHYAQRQMGRGQHQLQQVGITRR